MAALLVWADRRYRMGGGRVFALYVAAYTAGRFWIELLRVDPADHILGLRLNVWVAALVFCGAVGFLVVTRGRPRETVVEFDREPAVTATAGGGASTADAPDPTAGTGASAVPDATEVAVPEAGGTDGVGPPRDGPPRDGPPRAATADGPPPAPHRGPGDSVP